MNEFRDQADRPPCGSQQVAAGVDQVVEQIETMRTGLDQAAAFLESMRRTPRGPSMAGFNIPPRCSTRPSSGRPPRRSSRPTGTGHGIWCSPSSTRSAPRRWIRSTPSWTPPGRPSPTRPLQNATITIGGYPPRCGTPATTTANRHPVHRPGHRLRRSRDADALLRAITAPLYLVGSVIISYFGALGLGS